MEKIDWYSIPNEKLVEMVENVSLSEEERKQVMENIIQRFKYNCCPKQGETVLDVFARNVSDFVNGRLGYKYKEVARLMANDHRYLQQEKFKVMLEYIRIMAENYENSFYDPRNEYACLTSHRMMSCLE